MKTWMKSTLAIAIAVAATGVITSRVVSQQYEDKMQDMEAEMAAWIELAKPGKEHEALARSAGRWTQEVKHYMGPGQPMVAKGTSTVESILGGRFIVEHVRVEQMMGSDEPFEGMGIYGYDNGQKKYIYAWIDNMGTMIMFGEGVADATTGVVTYMADLLAPDGSTVTMKSVLDRKPDHLTHEMYMRGPDGSWIPSMGVESTRKR